MNVLVACEYSGIVRDAFLRRGHNAISCDLLPSESDKGIHYQGNVLDLIKGDFNWDMMIAHPPCTHLAVSGARWFSEGKKPISLQKEALGFVRLLMASPIPKICVENPVSVISTQIRKPEQIINPYQFGHKEFKKTCLWLKGLPPLQHTSELLEETKKLPKSESNKVHYTSRTKDRGKIRSRFYQGFADAMADQWGS
mgnify:FL=1|jgi:hypothetical protein|tara:strand:- start:619 stop:1209 length:591 start_codon:yes stop_codon:yes gene_type:complete